jgi:glycosyltransferase involved in cell wall biosynthesis
MSSRPLFSIIIPVFGTEPFLEQCLRSVKNQTFQDFECLIINDGSKGAGTIEFLENQDEGYQHSVDLTGVPLSLQIERIIKIVCGVDDRFRYLKQENNGLSSARNLGLTKARGKYALCLDSDDWLQPDHLEMFKSALKKDFNGKFPILYFVEQIWYNTHRKLNHFVPKKLTLANLIHKNLLCSYTWLLDLDFIHKHNLAYDEKLGRGPQRDDKISYGFEDWLFSYQYLEKVIQDFGKNGFVSEKLQSGTYMHRELNIEEKNRENHQSYLSYARYLQAQTNNNPDWNVRLTGKLYLLKVLLITKEDSLAQFLGKIVTLMMRVMTRGYF